jgi:hypothetical protein
MTRTVASGALTRPSLLRPLAVVLGLGLLAACAPAPQPDLSAPKPRPADAKTTLERGAYR